ncbi:hypothetical protein TNCV_3071001 [Trichonephila clavipes]|nr:hypothetical protein TNCV_3071001 [Trichonephila clavipes]
MDLGLVDEVKLFLWYQPSLYCDLLTLVQLPAAFFSGITIVPGLHPAPFDLVPTTISSSGTKNRPGLRVPCRRKTISSLEIRASDSLESGRLEFDVRCRQIPSEYTRSTCSLNQWVQKSCGPNHESRGLENISLPFSSMPKFWRWRTVVSPSIVPSGNFSEPIRTVTCMVLKTKANDKRTSSFLPR